MYHIYVYLKTILHFTKDCSSLASTLNSCSLFKKLTQRMNLPNVCDEEKNKFTHGEPLDTIIRTFRSWIGKKGQ